MWRMILDRRSFLSAVPALLAPGAVSGAEAERKTRFYVLEQFQLEQGPQTSRIHDFFPKRCCRRSTAFTPGRRSSSKR